MSVIRSLNDKRILCYLKPIDGYYIPNIRKPNPRMVFKNKGYRNLAYLLQAFLSASSQAVIDIGGTSRTLTQNWSMGWSTGYCYDLYFMIASPTYLNFGGLASPHDVTRYELFARQDTYGMHGYWFKEETASVTRLKTYNRYAIPATTSFSEVGLYTVLYWGYSGVEAFLLCRSIITPSLQRVALTLYEDGYQLEFPANYTRSFLEVLMACLNQGHYGCSGWFGNLIRATDGVWYVRRNVGTRSTTPDVKIGSSNIAPDTTHYGLQSLIASLSSQATSVEIDTTLQECRIIRSGTYTPAAAVNLGEVGQFIQVYDTGGTAREIMVARGIWDPVVPLSAGVTYTIGIVLRLG